ncbi:MFP1 attachment factor 1-like [Humulus lupulus]|uniref:MFP1 attachment factor 1-like n=1 Tax=Humulus lupulus TaxID=3486 RepID=UPI002B412556|nr:MFP1 attachment factor 1-like [Humulus lupulus]
MSDQESVAVTPPASNSVSEHDPTMEAPANEQLEATSNKRSQVKFSIWPPTQRTRDAVVNRLIETLSAPSVLSNRYGTLPSEEASSAARLIEEEAFSSAASSAASEDDGIQILQVYSKEVSKRMLDVVKARAAASTGFAPADGASQAETGGVVDSNVENEEASS